MTALASNWRSGEASRCGPSRIKDLPGNHGRKNGQAMASCAVDQGDRRQVQWSAIGQKQTLEKHGALMDHLNTTRADDPPRYPTKLSPEFSGALRTFSFWMANGTVGLPLLEGIDYRSEMLASPSVMEQAYAIFANVIELSVNGLPTNEKYAEHRAAQYLRSYCDSSYVVDPPFENWEVELFG